MDLVNGCLAIIGALIPRELLADMTAELHDIWADFAADWRAVAAFLIPLQ